MTPSCIRLRPGSGAAPKWPRVVSSCRDRPVSGVAVVAAPRGRMSHIRVLAGDAVRALEAAVDLGADLARRLAAGLAGQARDALDDPESRCAAGRTERTKLARQIFGSPASAMPTRAFLRAASSCVPARGMSRVNVPSRSVSYPATRSTLQPSTDASAVAITRSLPC